MVCYAMMIRYTIFCCLLLCGNIGFCCVPLWLVVKCHGLFRCRVYVLLGCSRLVHGALCCLVRFFSCHIKPRRGWGHSIRGIPGGGRLLSLFAPIQRERVAARILPPAPPGTLAS